MAIKRYIATSDNTITDALQTDLVTKGTGSNMGAADVLETFYIYGQVSEGTASYVNTSEKSRILVQFDVDKINADRSSDLVPKSGSVSWYLNLYNAPHAFTLPKDFKLSILPVSSSWQEGYGLDMENYTDQTYESTGSNWIRRGATGDGYAAWATEGGDFLEVQQVITASNFPSYTASFVDGTENISVDVSEVVEKWLEGATDNFGFGIFLSASYETGSFSHYTKKFFSRSSEYFFLKPNLEARWDETTKDSAANFVKSSSLATAEDNLNTLYLYNYVRGQLQNIPANTSHADPAINMKVSLYSSSAGNVYDKLTLPVGGDVASADDTEAVGGIVSTGIYTASLAMSHSLDSVYAVWHYDDAVVYHTSSEITVNQINASNYNPDPDYLTTMNNLKPVYSRKEKARFRLFIREKNWNPNNYTVMQSDLNSLVVEDAYYKIYRTGDQYEVISYGTGSNLQPQATGSSETYTRLSYDVSGNYFDFDIDLLQAGYQYGIKIAYYLNGSYREQEEVFKFKVED